MAYTAISDFKFGMDRRRPQSSGVPGTLWILKNAVLTRGGDIERARKFDQIYALPAGTHGYFSVRNQKYVFGHGTTPAGMPVGVRYQQLAAPSAPVMARILDAKGFDGKVYSIAEYVDGNIYHFYDGARVTDWDTLAAEAANFETIAERLASLIDAQSAYQASAFGDTVEITAAVPGTGFTIAAAATDNGVTTNPTAANTAVQANVAEVAEVRATGSVEITGGTASPGVNRVTSVTVDGVELLDTSVDWISSNDATANALAVEINNNSSTHGYIAGAASAVVTITAAVGEGATPNGFVVATTVAGNVTATDTNFSGGVDYVAPVAQVNTVQIGADDFATATVEVTGGTANVGTNRIASVTVNGEELLSAIVDWATSHAATATDLARKINGGAGTVTVTAGTSNPGTNRVTSIQIDSEELLSAPVDWTTSHAATATALAANINGGTGTHGFVATVNGAVVTIVTPAGESATLAGEPIVVTVGGDVTTDETNIAGGTGTHGFTASAASETVTLTTPTDEGIALAGFPVIVDVDGDVTVDASTFTVAFADDLWKITLDGDDYQTTALASATGTSLYVNQSRVYSPAGPLVRYCAINAPTDWLDDSVASGAGFINVSNEVEGATTVYGMARYQDLTAIFARNTIVTYSLPADATQTQLVQVLDNTGTIAPRSLVSYGANDVYYLDETGVRSLRTRDALDAAYASDVGSALDPFVQAIFAEVGEAVRAKACAVIEAVDGRFMLAIGPYVVTLSYFPSSKIVAWSYIDFGADISDMVRVGRSVQIRAGDTIYAYGGGTGNVYPDADEFEILAETPFISSKDPAGEKMLEGFDMAAENTWRVQVLPNPNDPAHFTDAGYVHGTTYHLPANKVPGQTSHFALRFTCAAAGYASLSSTAVHHSPSEKH